jgi:O-antigen ligase
MSDLAKRNFFPAAFMFFIGSQYIFAKPIFANLFFYGLLLPVFIWHFRDKLVQIIFGRQEAISKVVLLLSSYIILHTLLVRQLDWRTFAIIGSTASNYLFFIAAREYFSYCKDRLAFFKIMLIAASCGAFISILDYFINYNYNQRLRPWNSTDHEIAGASVYAICCLISGYIYIESRSMRDKLFCILACLAFSVVIVLTHSRGPMLALFCSGVFLGIAYFRWRFALCVLLFFLFGIAASYLAYKFSPESTQAFFNDILRPDAYRLSIFKFTFDKIMEHPWLGYGMKADFGHYAAQNSHNLFLGAAFYLGIPGFLLLMWLCALSFYQAARSNIVIHLRYLLIALMLYGITASLTDNSRIMRSPTGAWFFFWMPIGFTAGLRRDSI